MDKWNLKQMARPLTPSKFTVPSPMKVARKYGQASLVIPGRCAAPNETEGRQATAAALLFGRSDPVSIPTYANV